MPGDISFYKFYKSSFGEKHAGLNTAPDEGIFYKVVVSASLLGEKNASLLPE
jgi:hypothetical protein